MALFEKFRDTIFLKTDCELERKVEALKKLNEMYPDNKEIAQDLFMAEQGLWGEKEIMYELKNANIGMYVIHDLNIAFEDFKAQIDFVVITRGYIYFIECKNLIGNITVTDKGDFIREYVFEGKKVKKGIYSPIRQVDRQKDVFRKIWAKNNGKLFSFIYDGNFDKWYKTMVVMAKKENILNTKYAPKDIKYRIIRSDALVRQIEYDLSKLDKDLVDSKKRTEKIAQAILNLNVPVEVDYEATYNLNKENEVATLQETEEITFKSTDEQQANIDKECLREKLKTFRTETAKSMKIPPYYVFNNEELEMLLEKMPTSVEELKEQNILPLVKAKVHGQKIIDILNS
ncbi:MAG: NERD domain-containing protein [Clostridia bacterium]|nr:NERD domain-containing protein [Clostridia bacterium]